MSHPEQSPDAERIVDKALPAETPRSPEEARTAAQRVAYLLSGDHARLPHAGSVLSDLIEGLPAVLRSAFADESAASLLDVQRALFLTYEVSFGNPLSPASLHEHAPWLVGVRWAIEEAWLAYDLPHVEHELPSESDLADAARLAAWFVGQARRESPTDRLIVRFLAEEATLADFKTFFLIDSHLNYRFYDALALAQLHYSESVKEELSRHMWDECGQGDGASAHTRLFTRALAKLQLPRPKIPHWDDWRLYAGYNLYLCLGLNRRHYFKALGSLAMPELFDPDRDRAVIAGLARLGFDAREDFPYYSAHIEGDEEHGQDWLDHIIKPIVRAQPEAGAELALGAALRMEYMRRFNACLAQKFRLR
jgi:hypothetical protein